MAPWPPWGDKTAPDTQDLGAAKPDILEPESEGSEAVRADMPGPETEGPEAVELESRGPEVASVSHVPWNHLNDTQTGATHIRKGVICQDASTSGSTDDTAWAIVADGHGSERYFRSDRGAELACRALETAFAEILQSTDSMSAPAGPLPGRPSDSADQLGRKVLRDWRELVWQDLKDDPPILNREKEVEEPELSRYLKWLVDTPGQKSMRDFVLEVDHLERLLKEDRARDEIFGNHPWSGKAPFGWALRAYGATLLGAFTYESQVYWFGIGDGAMVQVGDGVATDLREGLDSAMGDETESLCSPQAARDIETGVFPVPPSGSYAVILTTDGIANSFSDPSGFMSMNREVLERCATGETQAELRNWLTEYSTNGSGDDVSLAMIYRQMRSRNDPFETPDVEVGSTAPTEFDRPADQPVHADIDGGNPSGSQGASISSGTATKDSLSNEIRGLM